MQKKIKKALFIGELCTHFTSSPFCTNPTEKQTLKVNNRVENNDLHFLIILVAVPQQTEEQHEGYRERHDHHPEPHTPDYHYFIIRQCIVQIHGEKIFNPDQKL